jgi:hypothetical protein
LAVGEIPGRTAGPGTKSVKAFPGRIKIETDQERNPGLDQVRIFHIALNFQITSNFIPPCQGELMSGSAVGDLSKKT